MVDYLIFGGIMLITISFAIVIIRREARKPEKGENDAWDSFGDYDL